MKITNMVILIAALLSLCSCQNNSYPDISVSETLIDRITNKPGFLTISPDLRRLAYTVKFENKEAVFADGKEKGRYDWAGMPVFSPDSNRLAYAARLGNKFFVVVDGKEGKRYDSTSGIKFSPDSKKAYYTAKSGNKWLLVIDGEEIGPYNFIVPAFSPDSKRLAYGAELDKGVCQK